MPPKKQMSKQMIIEKAFEIVRSEGYELLTARRLAKELNCSTQPIYQAFADMKELKLDLIKKAQESMIGYIMKTKDNTLPPGVAIILAYIQFAEDEKHLFQLIFTSGGPNLSAIKELDIADINLDLNMIIYANGIVMMQAFNTFALSGEKRKDMLLHAFELFEKEGKDEDQN